MNTQGACPHITHLQVWYEVEKRHLLAELDARSDEIPVAQFLSASSDPASFFVPTQSWVSYNAGNGLVQFTRWALCAAGGLTACPIVLCDCLCHCLAWPPVMCDAKLVIVSRSVCIHHIAAELVPVCAAIAYDGV